MFSIQFFWNIERKTGYPQAIKEFEMSHQMSVMMMKPGAKCTERTLDAAAQNVNLRDKCVETFQWY